MHAWSVCVFVCGGWQFMILCLQTDLHNMDTLSFALKRGLAQGGIKFEDEQECKTAAHGVQCD